MNDDATLGQAKNWLRARVGDGENCPCCGQLAKVYKRTLSAQMARALIIFYRFGGTTDWVHGPTLLRETRADEAKLRYWGLTEEHTEKRDDGGRAGYWRVTPAGEQFVHGLTTVPRFALLYDGRCLGMRGEQIDIHEALHNRFDYTDLMQGVIL